MRVKGILSFPNLFEPRAVEQGGDLKYSVTILIRKDDSQVNEIIAAIETAKANGFPSGFPATGKSAFKDCAVSHPEKTQLHEYYEIRSSAKADRQPPVFDVTNNPLMDRAQVFAGVIAYVEVNPYTYDMKASKGVTFGLNGVMTTGETGALGRLDNMPAPETLFADVAGSHPVNATPPLGQPMPPQPPAPPAAPAAPAQRTMTPAANGITYEAYVAQGWSDQQLIEAGMMQPPVQTSF